MMSSHQNVYMKMYLKCNTMSNNVPGIVRPFIIWVFRWTWTKNVLGFWADLEWPALHDKSNNKFIPREIIGLNAGYRFSDARCLENPWPKKALSLLNTILNLIFKITCSQTMSKAFTDCFIALSINMAENQQFQSGEGVRVHRSIGKVYNAFVDKLIKPWKVVCKGFFVWDILVTLADCSNRLGS